MNPVKIPVFYYKANGHITNTFIFEESDTHIWGLPEIEYPGLVKVGGFMTAVINNPKIV